MRLFWEDVFYFGLNQSLPVRVSVILSFCVTGFDHYSCQFSHVKFQCMSFHLCMFLNMPQPTKVKCDLFFFLWIQSSDADGLGSFSPLLPTKAKEADITSGDSACCPRGDCCHSCPCNVPTGPPIQCRGPHQVIPLSEMSTGLNSTY